VRPEGGDGWPVAQIPPQLKTGNTTDTLPAIPSVLGYHKTTGNCLMLYVDDHMMSGHDFWTHLAFLHEMYFPRVAFGPIPLSSHKSQFFMPEIESIGFQLMNGKILPAAKHRRKFERWAEEWSRSPPTTWHQAQQLAFMTPFLRRHIPGRADLVHKLKEGFFEAVGTTTVKGKKSVVTVWKPREVPIWTSEQHDAVQAICRAVQRNAITGTDLEKSFHIACDSSITGAGGVMFQLGPGSRPDEEYVEKRHFNAIEINMFMSFSFSDAEQRYSIPEKETLAVVRALKETQWITQASDYPIHVYTDHLSIVQSMTNLNEVHSKVTRWIDKITEFDVVFHHRPNTDRVIGIADGMSRLTGNLQDEPDRDLGERWTLKAVMHAAEDDDAPWHDVTGAELPFGGHPGRHSLAHIDAVRHAYHTPQRWYDDIVAWLLGGDDALKHLSRPRRKSTKRNAVQYRLKGNTLLRVEHDDSLAVCIKPDRRAEVLQWAHCDHGHFSEATTLRELRGRFWWPTRSVDVKAFIGACQICQATGPRLREGVPRQITAFRPMMLFGMDFMGPISPAGPRGKRYILVGVDYFTRFIFTASLPEATAFAVAYTMAYIWSPIIGWPWQTYTDNGSHFKNSALEEMFGDYGTQMVFGPVSHPRSTGMNERCVRLVKNQLMKWAVGRSPEELQRWPAELPAITNDINTRHSRSLGMSPAQAFLGFDPVHARTPDDDSNWELTPELFANSADVLDDVGAVVDAREENRIAIAARVTAEAERQPDPPPIRRFKLHDWVWEVRDKERKDHSKFNPRWVGPWKVVKIDSPYACLIEHVTRPGKPRKVHVDHLKKYHAPKEWMGEGNHRVGGASDDLESWMDQLAGFASGARDETVVGRELDLCGDGWS
jgi:hypothetical protein